MFMLPWRRSASCRKSPRTGKLISPGGKAVVTPATPSARATGLRTAKSPKRPRAKPNATNLGSILSTTEIHSEFLSLAREDGFETFTMLCRAHEKATIFGGKIGDNGGKITAPTSSTSTRPSTPHMGRARPLGRRRATPLGTGIVVQPLSNPDGVASDQATGSCWRKNRNPAGPVDPPLRHGLDTPVAAGAKLYVVALNVASDNPGSSTYHGVVPFSEPKTRSIR
ncbi:hypothetical protein DL765_011422 [Monosporascus sp. GIB2]|nr:hypothetical protein DL765_011422 [Monosporascus sp. GIB2]